MGLELPPRARRILRLDHALRLSVGTTSACAENTKLARIRASTRRNYLRVRGEYCPVVLSSWLTSELPPRARRILVSKQTNVCISGTTSACAENTPDLDKLNRAVGNYLRVRGEYSTSTNTRPVAMELPPRARRIRKSWHGPQLVHGTTSACAENTTGGPGRTTSWRNYLRVRGEYGNGHGCYAQAGELPPRARRILIGERQVRRYLGTTSACAENTQNQPAWPAGPGNYLRVRGEYETRT